MADVSGVPTQTWFPVVTLIIGLVLKGFFDFLTDSRTVKREREARSEQRRDTIHLQRVDFQRTTLLELQESAHRLSRLTVKTHLHYEAEYSKTGEWQRQELPEGVDEDLREAHSRVSLLRVRIRDEEARKLAEAFISSCVSVNFASSKEAAYSAFMTQMPFSHEKFQERIGIVLRNL